MVKLKNMIQLMIKIQYLKVNILMEKGMEKEKNINIQYLKENIQMTKDMEKENNMVIILVDMVLKLRLNSKENIYTEKEMDMEKNIVTKVYYYLKENI